MLGAAASSEALPPPRRRARQPRAADDAVPAASRRGALRAGTKLDDVSFELRVGEVLGVVALEGQGQDELFDVLSGSRRPAGGTLEVDGRPVAFRPPGRRDRAQGSCSFLATGPRRC